MYYENGLFLIKFYIIEYRLNDYSHFILFKEILFDTNIDTKTMYNYNLLDKYHHNNIKVIKYSLHEIKIT